MKISIINTAFKFSYELLRKIRTLSPIHFTTAHTMKGFILDFTLAITLK